jgi:prepilin-type N-terminal cleavage/methylation domain-containing protein
MVHSKFGRGTRGFTLVEMLLVLAIIAAIALVTIPWFVKISQRNLVKSSASQIQITLAAARMRAVKRNLPARVNIIPAAGPITVHVLETWEMTAVPRLVDRLEITPRVEFTNLLTNFPSSDIVYSGEGRVVSVCNEPVAPPAGEPCELEISGPVGNPSANVVRVLVQPSGRLGVKYPTNWN